MVGLHGFETLRCGHEDTSSKRATLDNAMTRPARSRQHPLRLVEFEVVI